MPRLDTLSTNFASVCKLFLILYKPRKEEKEKEEEEKKSVAFASTSPQKGSKMRAPSLRSRCTTNAEVLAVTPRYKPTLLHRNYS